MISNGLSLSSKPALSSCHVEIVLIVQLILLTRYYKLDFYLVSFLSIPHIFVLFLFLYLVGILLLSHFSRTEHFWQGQISEDILSYGTETGNRTPAAYFAKLLQNKLNGDVAGFIPPTSLATNKIVASCVNTGFRLGKITREAHHIRKLRHSLQNKFPLGR